MNVMALKFLRHEPAENWFDYFLHRDRFLALLRDENADRELIEQLFDQFVEQALALTSAKKSREIGDIEQVEQKADKLWFFGWACAARLGWDLEALLKCSNVERVFSMVSRLFEHTFGVRGESNILAYLSSLDDAAFDSKSVFVTWLYARLVLIIDRQARVPLPPQKPTVSNPANQVDPALTEAEKISSYVENVRKHARNATTHIERLIALKPHKIEIPNFHHFKQLDNQNGGGPTTSAFSDYTEVSTASFVVRAKCDLLLAHFAATHLSASRRLLDEIIPNVNELNKVHKNLRNLFEFDSKKLEGCKKALNKRVKEPRLDIDISDSDPYVFDMRKTPWNAVPTFKTNVDVQHSIDIYKSVKQFERTISLYSLPRIEEVTAYLNIGPPLWKMLCSFDYNAVKKHYGDFCEGTSSGNEFMNKIFKDQSASPIFLKMLSEAVIPNEPTLFYIKQLEKLVEGWHTRTWKTLAEPFLISICQKGHPWKEYSSQVCWELLRVNEKVFIDSYGHEMDNTSPDSPMQLSKKLTRDSAVSVTGQNGWGFGLIDKIYFVSFINLNLIEDAVDMHKRNTEFSNQYFTFVRFTGLLMSSDRGTENTDLQWKYFLPLTYKSSGSIGPSNITLPKDKFIEVVRVVKNPMMCEYILSFFVSLYNKGVCVGERRFYSYIEDSMKNDSNVSPNNLVDKQILNLNPIAVQPVVESNAGNIDVDFSVEVIEPLLRNYLQTYPRHPVAFCQLADVFYARESYKTAGSFYATIIYMFELDMWDSNHVDEIVTDPMISKLVHCLYNLKMYTLAAITGQLRKDILAHLDYVPLILKQTPETIDAGKAYFPYICNILLYEKMSETYDKFELNDYYISLLRLCTTKASNQSNRPDIVDRETARRRSKFVEVLFNTIQADDIPMHT